MSVNTGALPQIKSSPESKPMIKEWFFVVGLVYLLLVCVALIGSGFKEAAGENAKGLFAFANNPLSGLVIGTIATALIQSSSTVTSIIVGLVAGGLPVSIAIPMVMGANIGTTITNTIVSLGHVREGEEFKRAYAAATIHDFFNLLCVAIFLPLEMLTGYLSKAGFFLGGLFVGKESMSIKGFNFIKPIVKPAVSMVEDFLQSFLPQITAGFIMIMIGVVFIVAVITVLSRLLKMLMVGKAKDILRKSVGRGPVSGLFSGALLTVLVQSSSTTTSLVVPLAGNGVFSLRQIYPFTLGANIGTCITALLAATAITGANAVFALQIAFVHLLYNFSGVLVIYGLPFLRLLPVRAAETLASATVRNKLYALAYIIGVFFLVPSVLIAISARFGL
ncbi:Na/Pi symporter [Prosthecochloris sp. SCSIO W1101]|uniref:Na/Pi symporter n=1 Tax=Prosthecochloris sp. SCSIO W1101 TaxID=2992242 RepID=UPI00223D1B1B|nr:Na/Pi symporter [Prosthecochloris sp. SCSIO W1101]UZJ42147.1 Na/Pi symporter [Prosthecochloris sp. SCSIO W1101]